MGSSRGAELVTRGAISESTAAQPRRWLVRPRCGLLVHRRDQRAKRAESHRLRFLQDKDLRHVLDSGHGPFRTLSFISAATGSPGIWTAHARGRSPLGFSGGPSTPRRADRQPRARARRPSRDRSPTRRRNEAAVGCRHETKGQRACHGDSLRTAPGSRRWPPSTMYRWKHTSSAAGSVTPRSTAYHRSNRSRPFFPLIQRPKLRAQQFINCEGRQFGLPSEPTVLHLEWHASEPQLGKVLPGVDLDLQPQLQRGGVLGVEAIHGG